MALWRTVPFQQGFLPRMLEPFDCAIPKSVSSVATLLPLPKAATRQMPGAFQAGAKKDWFAGSLYLVVTISAAPEARRDGRQRFERKGWPRTTKYSYKKRGVGGDAAPQKQDVTEEKSLEKKRVIESEGVD